MNEGFKMYFQGLYKRSTIQPVENACFHCFLKKKKKNHTNKKKATLRLDIFTHARRVRLTKKEERNGLVHLFRDPQMYSLRRVHSLLILICRGGAWI